MGELLPNSVRRKANKSIPATVCEKCGTTERLQRHHPDMSKPLDVIILCQTCHKDLHVEAGTWGVGPKKKNECIVCGTMFLPSHSRVKTCGPQCLSERGRQNAQKRWGARAQE